MEPETERYNEPRQVIIQQQRERSKTNRNNDIRHSKLPMYWNTTRKQTNVMKKKKRVTIKFREREKRMNTGDNKE